MHDAANCSFNLKYTTHDIGPTQVVYDEILAPYLVYICNHVNLINVLCFITNSAYIHVYNLILY